MPHWQILVLFGYPILILATVLILRFTVFRHLRKGFQHPVMTQLRLTVLALGILYLSAAAYILVGVLK